jgi:sugar lactone lactonase YvrE
MNAHRLAVLVAVATAIWIIVGSFPSRAYAQQDLLVSARFGNDVLRYAGGTGASQGQFNMGPPLSNPAGLALDQAGNVYVANFNTNQVLEYSPGGTFLGVFASSASGFGFPLALRFGPDHNLYVTSNSTAGVYEFSGVTGGFLRVFASGGGLSGATGLTFLPGGDLLVSSAQTNQLLRYDGITGAFIRPFGTGVALNNPTDLQIGPDGNLYVSNTLSNQILRYNLATEEGSVFASSGLSRPIGLTFDAAGNLYVANQLANNVLRFAPDGSSLGAFVPAGSGGLNGPDYLAFTATPEPATVLMLCAAVVAVILTKSTRTLIQSFFKAAALM